MRQDKTVQYQPICATHTVQHRSICARTVQYQPICDTHAISTHMQHAQCNINPYATRTVQHRSIRATYSAGTDTDPCRMRHV